MIHYNSGTLSPFAIGNFDKTLLILRTEEPGIVIDADGRALPIWGLRIDDYQSRERVSRANSSASGSIDGAINRLGFDQVDGAAPVEEKLTKERRECGELRKERPECVDLKMER